MQNGSNLYQPTSLMITDLSTISIKGGCFEAKTELKDLLLNNINIVYGRNGSGKSTISRAIDEYTRVLYEGSEAVKIDATLPNLEISFSTDISEAEKNDIFVFNEQFVERTVKFEKKGLNTIVMLGKQIENETKLKIANDAFESLKKETREKEDKIKERESKDFAFSLPSQLKSLKSKLATKDLSWAERKRIIESKRHAATVNDESIANIQLIGQEEILTPEKISELTIELTSGIDMLQKTESIKTKIKPFPHIAIPIDVDTVNELLKKKLNKPEITEQSRKILQLAHSNHNYLHQAGEYFQKDDSCYCPYCLQDVSPQYKAELLTTIKAALSQEGELYKSKLRDINLTLSPQESLPLTPESYSIFPEVFNKIGFTTGKINIKLLAIKDIISERINNIYSEATNFIPDEFSNLYNEYNSLIDELNEKIKEANIAVEKREEQKSKLCRINDIVTYHTFKTDIDNYLNTRKEVELLKREFETKKEDLLAKKDEINRLTQELKSTSIPAQIINQILSFIFFDKERVSLKLEEGKYKLLVRGKPVSPESVSMGERNAIALSYFFANIGKGKSVEDIYKRPLLIVLDDPVSSFDFDNRIGIISAIRWQMNQAYQGNTKTKFLIFSHDASVVKDLVKCASDLPQRQTNPKTIDYSFSILHNKLLDSTIKNPSVQSIIDWSTYKTSLHEVYTLATQTEEESKTTPISGNSVRKALEAYSSFIYNKGFTSMMHIENILNGINQEEKDILENCMARLMLDGESHMQERAKTNDFYYTYSFKERQSIARTALRFLLHINEQHLLAYFTGDEVQTIKNWSLT